MKQTNHKYIQLFHLIATILIILEIADAIFLLVALNMFLHELRTFLSNETRIWENASKDNAFLNLAIHPSKVLVYKICLDCHLNQ